MRNIWCIALCVLATALAATDPLEVVQMSAGEIVLHFTLPDWELKDTIGGQEIDCNDAIPLAEEGKPILPFFTEMIGLPVNGSFTVEVLNRQTTEVPGVNIRPTYTMIPEENSVRSSAIRNQQSYRSTELYPAVFTNSSETAYIGDRCFAGLRVYPFQYRPGSQMLLVTTEATLRIRIQGNTGPSQGWENAHSITDNDTSSMFLNNEYSRKWRKPLQVDNTQSSQRTTDVSEVQIVVDEDGIYKITYAMLADSLSSWADNYECSMVWGVDGVDPRRFEMYDKDGEIPIHCVGESDGSFDPGDYIEFYGERYAGTESYYGSYTSENVYTLRYTDHLGARLAVENGGLEVNDPSLYTVPEMFEDNVHLEQQNTFSRLSAFPDAPREDLWFWATIYSPSMEIVEFNLQYPAQTTTHRFTARVMLMGSTHVDTLASDIADHHAEVRLNTSIIGNHYWFRQREQLFENEDFIANSRLNNGTNTLYISLPGDVPVVLEQVLLDYLDLTYWREYKTDSDILAFTKPSFSSNGLFQFELDNFSSDEVSIYKLGSSVVENFQTTPFTETGGAPYRVTFQDDVNSDDVRYYAVTESAKKTPKKMRPNYPSSLHASDNVANYVIITPRQFINSEGTLLLKQTWEEYDQSYLGRDMNVQIVALDDIFDEFSEGIYDPQAIQDFLAYAYNNWNYGGTVGRLEYVLLLGEGSLDERDDSAANRYNMIPVKYKWTNGYGATASDNWYVSIIGSDPVGDLGIGRICVWTDEQIMNAATKVRDYIENPRSEDLWHGHITLAAGGKSTDGTDIFAQQSESIRFSRIPMNFDVGRVYTRTQTVSQYFQGNTYALLDEINEGTTFLQFMGHGGGQVWSDNSLLDYNDILNMTNDKYPFVSSLACYCASFDITGTGCIGEAFLDAENSGAIGHFGFSGMGYLDQDLTLGLYMNEALFMKDYTMLGDAVAYTRAKVYASLYGAPRTALLEGSILLGDPLIRLRLPESDATVTLDNYNVREGDTINITASFPTDFTIAEMKIVDDDDVVKNTPYPEAVNYGILEQTYTVPSTSQTSYQRRVKFYGASPERELMGSAIFTVGRTAVMNATTLPESPSESDTVYILADFYDEDGLSRIMCMWTSSSDVSDSLSMIYDSSLGTYRTITALPAFAAGVQVSYYFKILDNEGNIFESDYSSYTVGGPDLRILTTTLSQSGQNPAINILIENLGSLSNPECPLELFRVEGNEQRLVLVSTYTLPVIAPLGQTWFLVTLPISSGITKYRIAINREKQFTESEYVYNVWNVTYNFNYQILGPGSETMTSLDGNAVCTFPTASIPTGTVAYINQTGTRTPVNEPDIDTVTLAYGGESISYEIGLVDTTIYADSTGLLPGGASMLVGFYIDPADSLGSAWSDEDDFGIYRWSDEYDKWIFQGGQVTPEHNYIVKYVTRCGAYTVLRNQDETLPAIDANVEEQEFTYGGYISGKGTVSLILSDENGIDVVDNPPTLYLDGEVIPSDSYHLSASPGLLINVPIKYQLDLDKGTYTLLICCSDVNGNYNEKSIPFIVNTTFSIINLANYPNPVMGTTIEPVNEGRTRFTYVLTDDADKVTLKIYTVTGRLVKTFRNLPSTVGYHEYPRTIYGWDCRDEDGQYLANGVYFYRLTAKRGNKTVEKIQKLAILK